MVKQIKTIDYDEDNDILFISDDEEVKASVDIGDFVLDVSHKNLIGGIEIMDASENLGVNKSILKSIDRIKMSINYKTNYVYVLLEFIFKKKNKEINVSIPLTLNLGHKVPRKELLRYN